MSESLPITPETENQIWHCENPIIFSASSDTPEARFVMPEDDAIKTKYRFIQDKLENWMQADPVIAGASAFGSTTKGYADVRSSDIDLTVFVEADRLGLSLDPQVITANVCWDDWCAFKDRAKLPVDYVDKAEEIFTNTVDTDSRLPIRAQVFPVSHEYLRILAGFEAKSALLLARYGQLREAGHGTEIDTLTDWTSQSSDADSLQALPDLMAALEADTSLSRHRDVLAVRQYLDNTASREGTEIAKLRSEVFGSNRLLSNLPIRLFNMSLTLELQPYRQSFLESIASGVDPDITWKFFAKRLAAFENSSKHPRNFTEINYPQSIEEASKWYS